MTHPSGFTASVKAGEVLPLWARPGAGGRGQSLLRLHEASGKVTPLTRPEGDDFQMVAHTVTASGDLRVAWGAETAVSVCYAFDPARAFDQSITVLWTANATKAKARRFRLHVAPPFGGINDPNGLIEPGGRTHLLYQHYPHAHRWNTMQ